MRKGALAGSLVAALAFWGLAVAPESVAGPSTTPVSVPADEAAFVSWHNALVESVQADPATFAGVRREDNGGYVVLVNPGVSSARAAQEVSAATANAAAASDTTETVAAVEMPDVRYEVSALSSGAMQAAMDAVSAAKQNGDPRVSSVTQWGPDPVSGKLRLGLDHSPTRAEARALAGAFGPDIVLVEELPSVANSRTADSAPWYGGNRIINASTGSACTSGFGVAAGSARYVLTAGHCGTAAYKVGSLTVGSTWKRSYANNGLDGQAISASSVAGRVWSGCLSCSGSVAIKGSWSAASGDNLCYSGSVSLWVCTNRVDVTNQCAYFSDTGKTTCHLTRTLQQSGLSASQPGDSGGPVVYSASSSTAYAAGIIVGRNGSSDRAWFQPVQYLLPALGVQLVLG